MVLRLPFLFYPSLPLPTCFSFPFILKPFQLNHSTCSSILCFCFFLTLQYLAQQAPNFASCMHSFFISFSCIFHDKTISSSSRHAIFQNRKYYFSTVVQKFSMWVVKLLSWVVLNTYRICYYIFVAYSHFAFSPFNTQIHPLFAWS